MIGFGQWLMALMTALLLHAAIILPWREQSPEPVVEALGGGLEIGLEVGAGTGSESSTDGTGDGLAVKAVAPIQQEQAKPARAIAVAKSVPAPAPKPVPEVLAEPIVKTETTPIETHKITANEEVIVVAQVDANATKQTATPELSAEPVIEQATKPSAETALVDSSAQDSSHGNPQGSRYGNPRGNGKMHGDGKAGGKGNGRILRNYFNELAALIDANKDYPGEVKKEKQEGNVIVAFTINREGVLLSSSVRKSSGYSLLDKAALATLQRSSPFPPIPKVLDRETLKIAVPIAYTLITD